MGVELGVWEGSYQNQTQRWLRWWDNQGNLLLTGSEQARLERLHTEQERQRAETERQRADRAEQTQRDAIPPTAGNGFNGRASGSGVVAVGGKSAIASCSSLGKVFNRAIARSSNSVIATTL